MFDWALTAQLLTQAVASELRLLRLTPSLVVFAGRIAAAAAMLALGQALRRRTEWARIAQILLCSGATLGGLLSSGLLITGHVGRAAILSALVMVTVAPWIAVRLASADTRAWFRGGRGREPVSRTGGVWLRLVVLQAAGWGLAVALSQSL